MTSFVIWGYRQNAEYDEANRDVDPQTHVVRSNSEQLERLYDTEDIDEAKAIARAGMYEKDGVRYIVVKGTVEA